MTAAIGQFPGRPSPDPTEIGPRKMCPFDRVAVDQRIDHHLNMTMLFVFAIALFAVLTAVALVRGLIAFHRDGERMRSGDPDAITAFGQRQNRMMSQRVLFQGIAVLLIAVLGAFAAQSNT